VYSSNGAFAALKSDGSVVAWGNSSNGGTTPGNVSSGVVAVYSTQRTAFAALKTTASTFDLSAAYYTDMDRYDILRKKENRRRVNLTTLNNNVFTLSGTRNLQVINPNIPSDKTFRIIVPTYVSSPFSITSTATIPSGAGSVIIACDEGESAEIYASYTVAMALIPVVLLLLFSTLPPLSPISPISPKSATPRHSNSPRPPVIAPVRFRIQAVISVSPPSPEPLSPSSDSAPAPSRQYKKLIMQIMAAAASPPPSQQPLPTISAPTFPVLISPMCHSTAPP
jgi:hypothetical protein